MKKFFTTIIALCFVLANVFSNPVNKKEAKQIAINFYNAYAPSAKAGFSIDKTIIEKYKGNESFYIFSFDKGGFVIVSADDCVKPILGYSFYSPVKEEFNSNIKYLFDKYNKAITYAAKKGIKDNNIKTNWEKLKKGKLSGNIKSSGPLLTTTWNQSPLYNKYCPPLTPVGCVATAMSQIMNYHEWPTSGNGWHKYIPEDHPEYGEQYANFGNETYGWSKMPNSLSSTSTTEEIDAVSTLCYHAGVSVNMNYTEDGSGAQSQDVLYALTNYFKYDPKTIEYVVYDSTNEAPYLDKIKNEIDNSRPIYYEGQGDGGGHAWVCDGYDSNDNVHINWGWGGYLNGYFKLSNMVPDPDYDFSDGNGMIIGIQPGTNDQDMLWTKQASGFKVASRGISNISAIDKRTAWALAYDGSGAGANVKEFTRTIDGNNWKSGDINPEGTDGFSTSMITAVDANTAWVALYDGTNGGGKIVRTSDGGKTWAVQSSASFVAPNGFPNVIHFWDANNGFCQGDPNGGYFEIYTTTNGGDTWTRVPKANIPDNLDKEYGRVGDYAVYNDIVWFATDHGRIFKSTDKGNNWAVVQLPFSNSAFKVTFRDANNGIVLTTDLDNNVMYRTTDGGTNWTKVNYSGNLYFNDIKYVPGTSILISTGSDYKTPAQGISYSTDDGNTFNDYANFYQNFQFLSIGAAGQDAIWAGGYNKDENNDGMWHYGNIPITANFYSDKNDYCAGDDVVFTDNSYGTPESWSWDFGEGATPATATGKGPHTITYSTSGLKNVTLTITNGTDQHVLVKKNYIQIAGSAPDDAGTITGESNVTVNETQTYSVADQDNVTFIWDIPSQWTGNSTTNAIDIKFTGTSGTGTITVTPKNGCGEGASGSLEITSSPSTGINDIDDNIFSIYPNPAKNYITVQGIESTDISIYNSTGILVKKVDKEDINSRIDISNLGPGIYYISIVTDNKIYTKAITVTK